MKIAIKKGEQRHSMTCERDDGTVEFADLGPSLPNHDLAHYVAETELKLCGGFYDNIARGYSVVELSDPNIIPTLGSETWVAEITARGVQSMSSSACRVDQFAELVNTELEKYNIPALENLSESVAQELLEKYQALLHQFSALKENESLTLNYDVPIQKATSR